MRFHRSGMAAKPSTNGTDHVQVALDAWVGRTVQVKRPDDSQFVTSYLALEDAQRLYPAASGYSCELVMAERGMQRKGITRHLCEVASRFWAVMAGSGQ